MIIRSDSDNKRLTVKIVFLIAFIFNTVISYSQIQDFDINVQFIHVTEMSVSFRYTVKNNTGNTMWLLTYSGSQLCAREVILYLLPLYIHFT
jgi:predicted small integral membrane protein